MSETEKPAEVPSTSAANGAGPPENSGGGSVTEKADEKENGIKKAAAEETGTHEPKDGDVKMTDIAVVKFEEQNEEGSVNEVEPMKVEGEEKETEELKHGQEADEESIVVKKKQKKVDVKTEDSGEKSGRAKRKSEVGNEEKDKESEEKGEETEEKGEQSKEKGEESEEKGEEAEEKGEDSNEEKIEDNEEEEGARKKRRRGRTAGEKSKGKEKKEIGKTKGVLRTPTTSSIDRPVRERKTVERLVEVVEKVPSKAILIEKGQGTPLKDIPNVAYKLSKKKPADIKSLHLLLFGRKGKAINFKSHIFQFSGFVWHENEDKQRAKVKEKLDKYVKDKLLDLCDVFDIPVSRATSRKEDLVARLLDFMVSPHATTDVVLAEKEQSAKSRKRKRLSGRSALRRCIGVSGKPSRKIKSEGTSKSDKSTIETEDEDEDGDGDSEEEDKENGLPDEDEAIVHSESEEEESEHDSAEEEGKYSRKGRQDSKKLTKKLESPAATKSKKVTTPKKAPGPASTRSPKRPYSKRFKADEAKDSNEEVFSRKKKNVVTPKKKMPSSNSDMEEKKTTGKKAGRNKAKSDQAEKSGPTEEELRKTICEILKEVDFNTATFTDILKKLASQYKMDLTARKASIKLMIQDELTKLADEAEEDEDDGSEDEGDTEKVENSEPAGKEVEA